MLKFVATIAAASVLLAASGGAEAKGKCVMAGGEGSGVIPDVAKFMATAALGNAIKAHGWKAQGPVKVDCKSGLVTTCTARQKACS